MDLEEKQKLVIPVEEIEAAWGRLIISVKTNLLVLPHRLTQMLGLSKSDRDTIDTELRTILETLGNGDNESSGRSSTASKKTPKPAAKNKRSRVGGKAQKSVT